MSSRLGIELAPGVLRAVRVDGWMRPRVRAFEVAFEGDGLEAAVAQVRSRLGAATRVAVAVELSSLLVKRVKLPPLPVAERRRILSLEPERWFAVRAEDLVVSVRDDDLVFAAREATLGEWLAALEPLGPVDYVEAAPVALARALRRAGVRHGTVFAADGRRATVVSVRDGELSGARVLRGGEAAAAAALPDDCEALYVLPWDEGRAAALAALAPGMRPRPVPPMPGVASVDAGFVTAYGAALAVGHDLDGALVPAPLRAQIVRRRRRDVAAAGVVCAFAFVAALASIDASRGRVQRDLAARVRALDGRAAEALAVQTRAQSLAAQDGAVAAVEAGRPDPLATLLSLSRALPRDAFVLNLRGAGAEWQVDGYAHDAARLVPTFERAPGFHEAHFLTATTAVRNGSDTYESFSLAFRAAPTP